MQHPAQAYGAIAKQTGNPRELEADLLLNAAARLQAIRDDWDGQDGPRPELDAALIFNRRLWSIFVTSATSLENPLPAGVRQNVANLGLFVFKQTLAIQADPKPETLGSLININRELAAGLLGRA
jgi:flagellar protein FlaF